MSGGESSGTFAPTASELNTTIRNDDYCRSAPTLWNSQASQIKFQAVYPLPYDFMFSGNFYTSPGVDIGAQYFVTNAVIEGSLGRPLAGCPVGGAACPVTKEINLIPNRTRQDDRITQLDIRLTRSFYIDNVRVNLAAELYNVFNARPVLGAREVFDANYLYPQGLLGGRFFKWAAQLGW